MVLPLACRRDSLPLTGHPSVIGPGGVGQASLHRGAVPPMAPSYVYSTYTYGLVGKLGASASPSRPLSQ
jgi:hypothetical protein